VVTFKLDLKRTPFSGMFIDTSEVPPITATLKTADPPSLKVTVPLPAPTPIIKPLSLALAALIVVVVFAAAPFTLISLSKAMIYLPYATVTLFEPTIVQPAVVLYTRIAASPTESKVIVVPPAKVVGVKTAVSPAALSAT